MKILVTGGAGFIGSHLVDALIEQKHEVVVLDDLSNGSRDNVNPAASFIKGDIRSERDVKKAIAGCEAVYHLAALIEVISDNVEKDFQVNFLGSRNVFSRAKQAKAKVIFTSSAAVYGDVKGKANEESKCEPTSQYGKSKLKAERFLQNLSKDACILRLFNVYGPRARTGVVKKFTDLVPKFKDVTVFGNGLQTRDFIFISDVVAVLLLCLESDKTKNEVYNVGTSQQHSVINVLDTIYSITGIKAHIKFAPERRGEIKQSCADITRLRQQGWSPKMELKDGLREMLKK